MIATPANPGQRKVGRPMDFPRAARVSTAAQYAQAFAQGRRTKAPLLTLHWLCDASPPRLGLAISRKVDPHAVGRNRIKRQLREQFRQLRTQLVGGAYVVVARAAAAGAGNAELRDNLIAVLRRAGALPATDTTDTNQPAQPMTLPG